MKESIQNVMNEQITFPGTNSVKVKMNDVPHFTFPLHSHCEYEIVYVEESYGTRYIGDSFTSFKAGDLVLLGSGLPHFYQSDESYLQGNKEKRVKSIVVQFPRDLLSFWRDNIPEFQSIDNLLQRSERGVVFSVKSSHQIIQALYQLHTLNGFDRLISLLRILKLMASEQSQFASGSKFNANMFMEKDSRFDQMLNYVNRNYLKELKLNDVSDLMGMNSSAFCRYFKKMTGKTFISYLQELRISYACKLIMHKQTSIKEAAYASGFNNISYFNRAFKQVKKMTPTAYLKQINS